MALILQTTVSSEFTGMNNILQLESTFISGSKWQWVSILSGNGLAPTGRETIIWTNDDLVYWHIHVYIYVI